MATATERAPPAAAHAMSCGVSPMTTTRAQASPGTPQDRARACATGTSWFRSGPSSAKAPKAK
ncbi:MAG: hypothetical protein R2712_23120 [Vicinamibacterales bacterium]